MTTTSQVDALAARIAEEFIARGPGVVAVIAEGDPIPGGTPTGLVIELTS